MPESRDSMATDNRLSPLAAGKDMSRNTWGVLKLEQMLAQLKFAAQRAGVAAGLAQHKYQFAYVSGGEAVRPMAILGTDKNGDVLAIAQIGRELGDAGGGYAIKRISNTEVADGKFFFSNELYRPMDALGSRIVSPDTNIGLDKRLRQIEERNYQRKKQNKKGAK